ncbi:MAG TPA: hypothetical protein VFV99_19420 [Kofleriaceae bacterium]|nr:hypothetical protein [Kofleriaceae bacterium]
MRAVLLAALLVSGCRIDLDHADVDANTSGRSCKVSMAAVCKEADSHSDFTWIKNKIFMTNCFGSSCHSGSTASGKLDLTDDPYTSLMGSAGTGTASNLDPAHQRVVAGDPASSYLFFIIHGVEMNTAGFAEPPGNVGYMPMSNSTLCCQKIDAIDRWITAGAMNN